MRPEDGSQEYWGPCCIPKEPCFLIRDGFAVERLTGDNHGDPVPPAVCEDKLLDGCCLWLPIHDRLQAVTPLQIEVSRLSNSLGVVGVMPRGSAFGAVLRSIAAIGEPGERLLNCFFWGSEDVEARSHEPVERDDP